MDIGDNIRQHRKALRLTLEDVADLVGISRQTMSRYETGVIDIPASKIQSLAVALQTTPQELFGLANAPPLEDEGEQELLSAFRQLNDEGRARVVDYAADLVATGRYMIDDDDKINFAMAAYGGGLCKSTITKEQLDALKKAIEETGE